MLSGGQPQGPRGCKQVYVYALWPLSKGLRAAASVLRVAERRSLGVGPGWPVWRSGNVCDATAACATDCAAADCDSSYVSCCEIIHNPGASIQVLPMQCAVRCNCICGCIGGTADSGKRMQSISC